ncbi:uncharacterized protein LOC125235025 [Leguminivora glycinivorella]|uniref:uncharacterized protein LOC125235025 n=1 Tax=Leguminivora glycinivorella TaxID=1035111 RepID=UPI00200E368A|nr:uncharacterized protein LOC125235025 [Leguminivora glycinivorella]
MGMTPGREREKLFSKDVSELTLANAIELAESVRCARTAASTTAASAPGPSSAGAENVFKIANTSGAETDRAKCQVCGSANHQSNKCKFASYKCQKCKKKAIFVECAKMSSTWRRGR